MPIFNAVVTIQPTPAVSVQTIGEPSYASIRKSLGDFVYKAYQLYLSSANIRQLSGIVQFKKYDVNGNSTIFDIVPIVSPYQQQNTLFLQMNRNDVVINGQDSFQFILLANTTLLLKLYSDQVSKESFVDGDGNPLLGESNFQAFETATGLFKFFEDFNNNIEWQQSNNPNQVKFRSR
jgi:hypothetical protein